MKNSKNSQPRLESVCSGRLELQEIKSFLTSQTKEELFCDVSENAAHKYSFAELQNALCGQKFELLFLHKTFQIPLVFVTPGFCPKFTKRTFTSYIITEVSRKLPSFFVVVKTTLRGTLGNVTWEIQNGGKQHIVPKTNI